MVVHEREGKSNSVPSGKRSFINYTGLWHCIYESRCVVYFRFRGFVVRASERYWACYCCRFQGGVGEERWSGQEGVCRYLGRDRIVECIEMSSRL